MNRYSTQMKWLLKVGCPIYHGIVSWPVPGRTPLSVKKQVALNKLHLCPGAPFCGLTCVMINLVLSDHHNTP